MLAISGSPPKAAFKTGHHFRVAVIYTFEEKEKPEFKETTKILNIAKGTTDPRVEFISQVQTQILIKFQNFDQASTSKSQPYLSILTQLKLQNLNQT